MSDEEITFAAMRRGYDGELDSCFRVSQRQLMVCCIDVMMFLNLAVAITCFAFCWTVLVVGFKGWLKSKTHSNVSFRQSA
jgi:hypothetical protein